MKYREEPPNRLFGTSGVRGVVHKDLSIGLLYDLGQAIATSLPPHSKVVIATDTRVSRQEVKTAVVKGLLASGVNVTDVGILPTPALAFVTRDMGMDTGLMVTASHNPPEYSNEAMFDEYVRVSRVEEAFYPLVITIPLQLLAYHSAISRGLDPDKPRNLAKSVMVK